MKKRQRPLSWLLNGVLATLVTVPALANGSDRFAGFEPRLGTLRPDDKPEWFNWDNWNRAEAQDAYYRLYVPLEDATSNENFSFATLPNLSTNHGGSLHQEYKDDVVRWINAARYLASDIVATYAVHDATYDRISQDAALLMVRNERQSHEPTPDWIGYNASADEGAKGLLGGPGVAGVKGFIQDLGAGNYFVGHRQTLLDRIPSFSIGAVYSPPSGLQVPGGTLRAGQQGVIRAVTVADIYPRNGDPLDFPQVYPFSGYVADHFVKYLIGTVPRVSLQFDHAAEPDYTNATIEVWRDGVPIPHTRLHDTAYNIVFDLPPNPNPWDQFTPRPILPDTEFRVRVSGIRFSRPLGWQNQFYPDDREPGPGIYDTDRTYEWSFTIFDESHVAPAAYRSSSPVANISTRATIGQGYDVLIGGFVIEGTEPLRVVVRAMGPFLKEYGIEDAAEDPQISIFRAVNGENQLVGRVSDWKDEESWRMIESFGLAPEHDGEVSVVATLPPGAYSAVVEDTGAGGIGIVEVYAADLFSTSKLANVSTRGIVGNTGLDLMIGGIVLEETRTLVVRARGPELSDYGVEGFLPDPRIQVFRGQEEIFNNDDWEVSDNERLKGDLLPFKPANEKEPAGVLTLPAGAYTVLVTGVDDGTGVALVEIYDVTDF